MSVEGYELIDKLPESAVPYTFDRESLSLLVHLSDDGVTYALQEVFGETYILKLREVEGSEQ